MEEFLTNMAIASFGLLIAGAILLSILDWLSDQFMAMGRMDMGDWIGLGIFFGVAALVASTM